MNRLMDIPLKITSPWGYRIHPIYKKRTFHNGVDLRAPENTPLHCPEPGTVMRVWTDDLNGTAVRIKHKDKITAYAHLNSTIPGLEGYTLKEGDVFAYTGMTGTATGPHLHFGIQKDGTWIDPTSYVHTLYLEATAMNLAVPIAIIAAVLVVGVGITAAVAWR